MHLNSSLWRRNGRTTLALPAANRNSAEWWLIHAAPAFFTVTKSFHNALQGGPNYDLPKILSDSVPECERGKCGTAWCELRRDIVHDPQPAAIRYFAGRLNAKWISRCPIDSSAADRQLVEFLATYIDEYDALVFTMLAFLLPRLDQARASFIAPAIDWFATMNIDLPIELAAARSRRFSRARLT